MGSCLYLNPIKFNNPRRRKEDTVLGLERRFVQKGSRPLLNVILWSVDSSYTERHLYSSLSLRRKMTLTSGCTFLPPDDPLFISLESHHISMFLSCSVEFGQTHINAVLLYCLYDNSVQPQLRLWSESVLMIADHNSYRILLFKKQLAVFKKQLAFSRYQDKQLISVKYSLTLIELQLITSQIYHWLFM